MARKIVKRNSAEKKPEKEPEIDVRLASKIILKNVDELREYEKNARTHPEKQIKQICQSIKEFGFTNPVLIDGKSGIIAGHGRLVAARRLGLKRIPTVDLSYLSDTQKRAYIIADNRIPENAGWNMDFLREEMFDLKGSDFDLDTLGFDMPEMDRILGLIPDSADGKEYDESAADGVKLTVCPHCGGEF